MPYAIWLIALLWIHLLGQACGDDRDGKPTAHPRPELFSICNPSSTHSVQAKICPSMQAFLQQALYVSPAHGLGDSLAFRAQGYSGICLYSRFPQQPTLAQWYSLTNHLLYARQHHYSYTAALSDESFVPHTDPNCPIPQANGSPISPAVSQETFCHTFLEIPPDGYFWQIHQPLAPKVSLTWNEQPPSPSMEPHGSQPFAPAPHKPNPTSSRDLLKTGQLSQLEQHLLHQAAPWNETDIFNPAWLFQHWHRLNPLQAHMDLFAPPVVWSRGYYDLIRQYNTDIPPDYFLEGTESQAEIQNLIAMYQHAHQWIWLRNGSTRQEMTDVDHFAHHVLPLLQHPVRLITTDGDRSIPGDLAPKTAEKLLASEQITAWYTQNYDGTMPHHKWRPIPIGLDLHCCSQEALGKKWLRFHQAQQQAIPWHQRQGLILLDAMSPSHKERRHLRDLVQQIPHITKAQDFVSYEQALMRYGQYQFVISPRGNGLDCHRTWDILSMGAIPIVRSSSLDVILHDLPVLIVRSWEELRDPGMLQRWLVHNSHKLVTFQPLHHLSRAYWLERIDMVSSR